MKKLNRIHPQRRYRERARGRPQFATAPPAAASVEAPLKDARIYRSLYQAGYAGLQAAGIASPKVLIGETAPEGETRPASP